MKTITQEVENAGAEKRLWKIRQGNHIGKNAGLGNARSKPACTPTVQTPSSQRYFTELKLKLKLKLFWELKLNKN